MTAALRRLVEAHHRDRVLPLTEAAVPHRRPDLASLTLSTNSVPRAAAVQCGERVAEPAAPYGPEITACSYLRAGGDVSCAVASKIGGALRQRYPARPFA